ncbi:MAG: DUF4262 domain-containing protein [Aureliella sp.]
MDDEIAEVVREFGWYCASVSGADPPFLYTIGLMETHKHPEFIVFGLDADNAHALLAGLVTDIRNGRRYSESGVYSIDLGGDKHRIGIRKVHSTQHPLYLGLAMGFVRNIGRIGELEVMQLFWPDSFGKFPFDVGCNAEVAALQPRIDVGLTPREVRQFERRWE